MKRLLLGGLLLGCLACPVSAQGDEEGERTFRCYRYERDSVRQWRMESITVEAHTAQEAITMCFEILRDRVKRSNKRIVLT